MPCVDRVSVSPREKINSIAALLAAKRRCLDAAEAAAQNKRWSYEKQKELGGRICETRVLRSENSKLKLELLKWRKRASLLRLRLASVDEDAKLSADNQRSLLEELQVERTSRREITAALLSKLDDADQHDNKLLEGVAVTQGKLEAAPRECNTSRQQLCLATADVPACEPTNELITPAQPVAQISSKEVQLDIRWAEEKHNLETQLIQLRCSLQESKDKVGALELEQQKLEQQLDLAKQRVATAESKTQAEKALKDEHKKMLYESDTQYRALIKEHRELLEAKSSLSQKSLKDQIVMLKAQVHDYESGRSTAEGLLQQQYHSLQQMLSSTQTKLAACEACNRDLLLKTQTLQAELQYRQSAENQLRTEYENMHKRYISLTVAQHKQLQQDQGLHKASTTSGHFPAAVSPDTQQVDKAVGQVGLLVQQLTELVPNEPEAPVFLLASSSFPTNHDPQNSLVEAKQVGSIKPAELGAQKKQPLKDVSNASLIQTVESNQAAAADAAASVEQPAKSRKAAAAAAKTPASQQQQLLDVLARQQHASQQDQPGDQDHASQHPAPRPQRGGGGGRRERKAIDKLPPPEEEQDDEDHPPLPKLSPAAKPRPAPRNKAGHKEPAAKPDRKQAFKRPQPEHSSEPIVEGEAAPCLPCPSAAPGLPPVAVAPASPPALQQEGVGLGPTLRPELTQGSQSQSSSQVFISHFNSKTAAKPLIAMTNPRVQQAAQARQSSMTLSGHRALKPLSQNSGHVATQQANHWCVGPAKDHDATPGAKRKLLNANESLVSINYTDGSIHGFLNIPKLRKM